MSQTKLPRGRKSPWDPDPKRLEPNMRGRQKPGWLVAHARRRSAARDGQAAAQELDLRNAYDKAEALELAARRKARASGSE